MSTVMIEAECCLEERINIGMSGVLTVGRGDFVIESYSSFFNELMSITNRYLTSDFITRW